MLKSPQFSWEYFDIYLISLSYFIFYLFKYSADFNTHHPLKLYEYFSHNLINTVEWLIVLITNRRFEIKTKLFQFDKLQGELVVFFYYNLSRKV